MSVQHTYLDGLDDRPDWSNDPQTPEEFKGLHRFLYRGAFFIFLLLAIDGLIIFPLMVIKHGFH